MFYQWFDDLFEISNFEVHPGGISQGKVSEITKVMFIEIVHGGGAGKFSSNARPYYFKYLETDTYIKSKGRYTKWLRKANSIRRKKKLKK